MAMTADRIVTERMVTCWAVVSGRGRESRASAEATALKRRDG